MSGYVIVNGPCWTCRTIFAYNPNHVPSVPVRNGEIVAGGVRHPICEACMNAANAEREAKGQEPHPIHPQAYEPEPEGLL